MTATSPSLRCDGLSYFIWGKFDEATASGNKAIELDPDNFIAYWTLGRHSLLDRRSCRASKLFHARIDISRVLRGAR